MFRYIFGYLVRIANDKEFEWDYYYDSLDKTYYRNIGITIHRVFIGIRIYYPE